MASTVYAVADVLFLDAVGPTREPPGLADTDRAVV